MGHLVACPTRFDSVVHAPTPCAEGDLMSALALRSPVVADVLLPAVLDAMNDGVLLVDPAHRIEFANLAPQDPSFLRKPWTIDDLVRRVRQVTEEGLRSPRMGSYGATVSLSVISEQPTDP
jgi:PAS domain-containing protein